MRKILYLVTQSEWGGAQKYVFDLAVNLAASQNEVVVGAGQGDGELFKKLEAKNIKTLRLKRTVRAVNPLKDILAVYELIKVFKQEKPDIIHLNSSKMSILGSLAGRLYGKNVKIIYTVHGWVFNEPLPYLIKGLYYILEKWTAKFKNVLITVSDYDRQIAVTKNLAPAEKVITINNGVETLEFYDRAVAREKLQAYGPLKPPSPVIGTIANLYQTKGLDVLIKAAAIIIKDCPELKFMVIGEGAARPKLESLIRIHNLKNNFILTGAVSQAARLLKAFDIFVLPSLKEGWPYTLLEAAQAGLPIVATKVGGLPEIIQNGQNGLLVNPGKPAELAAAIMLFFADPARAADCGRKAATSAEQFTLQNTVEQTLKLYQNL